MSLRSGAKARKVSAKKVTAKSVVKKAPPAPEKIAKPLKVVPKKIDEAKKALARVAKSKTSADKLIPVANSPQAQKWASLHRKAEAMEAKPYNMRQTYSEKTAIVHKVMGWGYILANRNDRLEVLFKDGIKYLISNYK